MVTAAKGVFFEDLSVGQEASLSTTVSEADIVAFAEISGDKNPVHIDAQYAAGTMFKERIAHGMLSAAYISAVFGMKLPGPGAIYISQTLNFQGAGQDRRHGRHHGEGDRAHRGKEARPLRDREQR
jgi:3-hydroxybutyryl-CoA dehydratase